MEAKKKLDCLYGIKARSEQNLKDAEVLFNDFFDSVLKEILSKEPKSVFQVTAEIWGMLDNWKIVEKRLNELVTAGKIYCNNGKYGWPLEDFFPSRQ